MYVRRTPIDSICLRCVDVCVDVSVYVYLCGCVCICVWMCEPGFVEPAGACAGQSLSEMDS